MSFFATSGKNAETVQTANAHVAQSVERVLGKDEVTSSTLVMGSSLVAV